MKEKGFTLAEILGTLVIIGLLLLLVGPGIINRIRGNREKVSKATEEIIYSAASQHIYENKEKYPNGRNYCIKVQELIDEGKLASPVQDVTTNTTYDNSSVLVTLYSTGIMEYKIERDNEKCEKSENLPIIEIEVIGTEWKNDSQIQKVRITYPNVPNTIYPKEGSNYQYSTPNENHQNYDIANGFSKEVEVTESGIVHAEMMYGNKKVTAEKEITIGKDTTAPTCDGQTGGNTTWKKSGTVTVGAKCKDTESGCTQEVFSSTISGNGKTEKKAIEISDKAGNKRTCEYTYNKYIDTEDPKCTWSGESATWTNANRTIKVTGSDSGSGIDDSYKAKSWTYSSGTTKTASLSYEVRDKLGNKTNCSKTANIYVDKNPPTFSSLSNSSDAWTKADVTVTLNGTDSGSGIGKWEKSSVKIPIVKNRSHVQTIGWGTSTENGTLGTTNSSKRLEAYQLSITNNQHGGGITYRSNIEGSWQAWKSDGETSGTTGQGKMIYAVEIKLTGDLASYYNVRYRTHVQTLGWTSWKTSGATESQSGKRVEALEVELVSKKEVGPGTYSAYSSSASNSYSAKITSSQNTRNYFRVCDKAGNCSDYKVTNVSIDKTKPVAPTITNPTSGNWTNADFALRLKGSDTWSGIDYYQYTYASGASSTGSDNTKQWVTYSDYKTNQMITSNFSAARNQAVYIRACDKVGNCSDKASTRIRIDKTAPTMSAINHSGTSATITATCSDSGSGVKNSSVSATATGNKTQTLTLTCEDKAGNKTTKTRTMTYYAYSCSTCYRKYDYSCKKCSSAWKSAANCKENAGPSAYISNGQCCWNTVCTGNQSYSCNCKYGYK